LRETVAITAVMLLANAACSWFSIVLGPYFYGYGFASGMLIATVVALPLVNRRLSRLNYETFMHTR
ncbi:MAG: exopolysaccharide Pel transporter PelG, partial [Rhodanobacter sp.]